MDKICDESCLINLNSKKNKLGEKHMGKETTQNQSRREFLTKFGIFGTLTIGVVALTRNFYLFFTPSKKEKTYHKYLVGKVNEIPVGKAKEILIQKKPVFVVHLEDGFKVFSGICTHLGCIVKWEDNKNRFYCPCHKGIFDKTGKVTGGPPPAPLDEFTVEIDRNLIFVQVKDKVRSPWS